MFNVFNVVSVSRALFGTLVHFYINYRAIEGTRYLPAPKEKIRPAQIKT
jgi:hypothetical protein